MFKQLDKLIRPEKHLISDRMAKENCHFAELQDAENRFFDLLLQITFAILLGGLVVSYFIK
jgi:hypothetical protein